VCDDDAADREYTKDGKYVERLLIDMESVGVIAQDEEAKRQDDYCCYHDGGNGHHFFTESCELSHKSLF
jgi:hypothetical protein